MKSQYLGMTVLILLILSVTCAFAMIGTLKLPDLIRQADVICVAKVVKVAEIAVDKDQVSTIKNVLLPEKVIKGTWALHEPIVLMTKQCGKAGQIGWIEDRVECPPKGSRVVLFLRQGDDGSLETVNSVQGLWPMYDNKPDGMGRDFSIAQIQELVKQQKN